MAGLAAERLDLLSTTMLAIPNQRVGVRIGVAEVLALLIGTGIAFGVHALGGSSPAFHLAPGAHRPRRCLSTRRGSGGETTGRAIVWAAGLEQTGEPAALGPSSCMGRLKMEPAKMPKQCQREEEEHEHEQKHVNSHTNPRCLKGVAGTVSLS
jgi:hypothetical protein